MRLGQILLDPAANPIAGGNGDPATPVPAAPNPATNQTPPPADTPSSVTTLLFQRLTAAETRAAQLEAAERQRAAEAERREQDTLAARGDAEAARAALTAARDAADRDLAAARAETDAERSRARNAFRDRELALALSNYRLNPGAAAQLMTLLRGDLDAHPEGDSYAVRTRDFVSVGDYVARQLAHGDFAHFLQPSTTGGTGSANGHRPSPSETPVSPADRLAAQLRQSIANGHSGAPGLDGNYGGRMAARSN